jgi:hypothetical protein
LNTLLAKDVLEQVSPDNESEMIAKALPEWLAQLDIGAL